MKTFFRILGILAILLIVFSIFIALKPSDYDVKRTKQINAPASVIFNTINEYKTWIDWGPWKASDPTISPSYPEQTSGVGGGYSWTSEQDGPGRMETMALTEYTAIDQKIYFDIRGESDVYWRFNETEKGTDVTWGMKGKLDFMGKVYFYFMGGPEKVFGKMFFDGLNNLDAYLQTELDKHSFTNNGVVEFTGGYYIHLTTACSFDEMGVKMPVMLDEVLNYAKQQNYPMAGAPFMIYHSFDEVNKKSEFSCCVPVRERVNPDGAIALAHMEARSYHKTTFQGDSKFSEAAWNKAFEFAKEDGIEVPENSKPFEVYSKGKINTVNPADWVTEIYLPIE